MHLPCEQPLNCSAISPSSLSQSSPKAKRPTNITNSLGLFRKYSLTRCDTNAQVPRSTDSRCYFDQLTQATYERPVRTQAIRAPYLPTNHAAGSKQVHRDAVTYSQHKL
jgi:hypothetical protein